MSDFAEKLNMLFDSRLKPDGKKYSSENVSKATNITAGAISKLRTGKSKNPSYEVIKKLSDFFDISADYFFNDSNTTDDKDIDQIALRSIQLTPSGREALLGMIEKIIQLESKLNDEQE